MCLTQTFFKSLGEVGVGHGLSFMFDTSAANIGPATPKCVALAHSYIVGVMNHMESLWACGRWWVHCTAYAYMKNIFPHATGEDEGGSRKSRGAEVAGNTGVCRGPGGVVDFEGLVA
jgi:hypothetical protein